MEVHNEMGSGHLEAVYQECLDPPIFVPYGNQVN
jgi:hypothetical protein